MSAARRPFEPVVVAHGPTVLRVCQAVLGRHADAEDAWSETFLAALRAWPGLPEEANVEAWLVTIAHRKALDAVRARGRRAVPAGDLPEPAPTPAPDPEDAVPLLEAVRALPARQRQAVAYHYLAGLPYKEIAPILGGTAEAARRAAADGMRSLRDRCRAQGSP